MKVIAVEQAKMLHLVPLEEIRPNFGIYIPGLIKSVAERYEFATVPKDLGEAITSGAKFELGHLKVDGVDIVVRELGVYSDGFIVDTLHSTMSERILDDLLGWTKEKYQTREPTSVARRTCAGIVVFEFEREVESALGTIGKVAGMLSAALKAAYGWDHSYNLQRIGFSVDPTTIPHLRNTAFFIERRVQMPFPRNRFYSGAPLPTDQHIALLEEIEREVLS